MVCADRCSGTNTHDGALVDQSHWLGGPIMTMRITDSSGSGRCLAGLQATPSRLSSWQAQLSTSQDTGLAEPAMRVSAANVNYQAARQTMATIRQISLLHFLT